jgi:hypothetical protein
MFLAGFWIVATQTLVVIGQGVKELILQSLHQIWLESVKGLKS